MTAIVMDLNIALWPPSADRLRLLALAERDGLEIYCVSYLGPDTTKAALADAGLLQYFDDLLFPDHSLSDEDFHLGLICGGAVVMEDPAKATYKDLLAATAPPARRLIHRLTGPLTS